MKAIFHAFRKAASMLLLLAGLPVLKAGAGFSSIYTFGDGVCTTTDSPSPSNLYHEGRRCNGKVWIEVISQWQGIAYVAVKNKSFYGHDSVNLNTSVNAFSVPGDAASSLFIVWSANADFVNYASDGTPWNSGALSTWNTKITQSINRHQNAVNTLYGKGARFLMMPNAADIASIPLYNNRTSNEKSFFRNRVIDFNAQLATAMGSIVAGKSDLIIIIPDVFSFFEQVQANPTAYGMVNPIPNNAATIHLTDKSLTGPGANYVFWDPWHPTAKFQMHLAAFMQQIISPVKVNGVTLSGGNVHMEVANIPLGRNGVVLGSANLQPPWAQDAVINEPYVAGGATTKTVIFSSNGPRRFYRTAFPVVWTWP